MSPTERAEVQGRLLSAVKASVEGGRPSNTELGDTMHCDRSEVSRFERGERRMDLDELEALADRYGADAVYGSLLLRHGRRLVVLEAPGTVLRELPRASSRVTRSAAELGDAIAEALSDGRVTDEEAEDLQRRIDGLAAEAARLCSRRVRAGRA